MQWLHFQLDSWKLHEAPALCGCSHNNSLYYSRCKLFWEILKITFLRLKEQLLWSQHVTVSRWFAGINKREIDEARTKGRSMKLDKISLQIFANPFWAWELDLQTIVSRWPLLRLASRWLTPSTPFGPPTGFELCLGCQISASPDLSSNFQQLTIKLWKTTPFLKTLYKQVQVAN